MVWGRRDILCDRMDREVFGDKGGKLTLPTPEGPARQGFVKTMTATGLL